MDIDVKSEPVYEATPSVEDGGALEQETWSRNTNTKIEIEVRCEDYFKGGVPSSDSAAREDRNVTIDKMRIKQEPNENECEGIDPNLMHIEGCFGRYRSNVGHIGNNSGFRKVVKEHGQVRDIKVEGPSKEQTTASSADMCNQETWRCNINTKIEIEVQCEDYLKGGVSSSVGTARKMKIKQEPNENECEGVDPNSMPIKEYYGRYGSNIGQFGTDVQDDIKVEGTSKGQMPTCSADMSNQEDPWSSTESGICEMGINDKCAENQRQLYVDHDIKEGLVISKETLHQPVYEYTSEALTSDNKQTNITEKSTQAKYDNRSYVKIKPLVRTDTQKKKFACDICGYKFANNCHLKRHIRTHTGEKPFACEMCDNKFSSKSHLKIHTRTHTGDKPFTCNVCEYKFYTKSDLNRHARTHTGDKPFACEVCECKFKTTSDLKRHMMTHTGNKPFACSICQYKCISKSDLKIHTRTHTGEKPFACDLCEYKCSRKSDLKKHKRIHTTDKPFACSICEYKCTSKSDLQIHTRTHAGEKLVTSK